MSALSWKLIELILMGIANSVIIVGWHKITYYEIDLSHQIDKDSKMFLWRVRKFFSGFISEWEMKPLFTCIVCMASIHGSWFYWLCQPFTIESLKWWIPYMIGLAGYNYVYISSRI